MGKEMCLICGKSIQHEFSKGHIARIPFHLGEINKTGENIVVLLPRCTGKGSVCNVFKGLSIPFISSFVVVL